MKLTGNRCYLCGGRNVRVEVDSLVTSHGTFFVCGVCDERGEYCYGCERPIRSEEQKFYKSGPWGAPDVDPWCVQCYEALIDERVEAESEYM